MIYVIQNPRAELEAVNRLKKPKGQEMCLAAQEPMLRFRHGSQLRSGEDSIRGELSRNFKGINTHGYSAGLLPCA